MHLRDFQQSKIQFERLSDLDSFESKIHLFNIFLWPSPKVTSISIDEPLIMDFFKGLKTKQFRSIVLDHILMLESSNYEVPIQLQEPPVMKGVKGLTSLLNLMRMQAQGICLTYTRLDFLKNIRFNLRFEYSIHFQKKFNKFKDFVFFIPHLLKCY